MRKRFPKPTTARSYDKVMFTAKVTWGHKIKLVLGLGLYLCGLRSYLWHDLLHLVTPLWSADTRGHTWGCTKSHKVKLVCVWGGGVGVILRDPSLQRLWSADEEVCPKITHCIPKRQMYWKYTTLAQTYTHVRYSGVMVQCINLNAVQTNDMKSFRWRV